MTLKSYFVENTRRTSVMISKDRVSYQELQKIILIFSKIKLFRQRDNIEVRKKNGKEKNLNSFNSNSKHQVTD